MTGINILQHSKGQKHDSESDSNALNSSRNSESEEDNPIDQGSLKPDPSQQVNVIDRGIGSEIMDSAARVMTEGLLESHTFFLRRQGISERLIYLHCFDEVLKKQRGPIIAPNREGIHRRRSANANASENRWVFLNHALNITVLDSNKVYTMSKQVEASDTNVSEFLENLYRAFGSVIQCTNRILLVIDVFSPPSIRLQHIIRRWMFSEKLESGITVWLHCSPHLLPEDILGQCSNVIAIRPTTEELIVLRKSLTVSDFDIMPFSANQESKNWRLVLS